MSMAVPRKIEAISDKQGLNRESLDKREYGGEKEKDRSKKRIEESQSGPCLVGKQVAQVGSIRGQEQAETRLLCWLLCSVRSLPKIEGVQAGGRSQDLTRGNLNGASP